VSQLEGKTPTRSESNKKVSFSETKKAEKPADDDDDVDLFGSDDEDNAEAEELKKKRVEEYAAKKAKSMSFNHFL
jgi:elongation factor 1-beta